MSAGFDRWPLHQAAALYATLANAVLMLHTAVVLFVVGGLLLVVAGNVAGWPWVNRLWFRLLHLAAIITVVAQSWLGVMCPLTTLESWLRQQDGTAAYSSSFIEHWLHQLLFYEAPSWVFTLAYSVFALLVAASWWVFPPRRHSAPPASGHAQPVVPRSKR